MTSRAIYIVSGQLERSSKSATAFNGRGWFAEIGNRKWRRLSTGLRCRDYRHAAAQYRRLKVNYRQIDKWVGRVGTVIKYGKEA